MATLHTQTIQTSIKLDQFNGTSLEKIRCTKPKSQSPLKMCSKYANKQRIRLSYTFTLRNTQLFGHRNVQCIYKQRLGFVFFWEFSGFSQLVCLCFSHLFPSTTRCTDKKRNNNRFLIFFQWMVQIYQFIFEVFFSYFFLFFLSTIFLFIHNITWD